MGRRQGERRQRGQHLSSPHRLTRRYYYAPATLPSDGDKWLLMLEGGEWCYDAPSCAQRAASQPDLLTSHGWYPHKRFSGVFETDEAKSPFHSVNKIYVPYCSSDAWVGDTTAGGLTFAGQRIVAAVLRALATVHGLGQTPGQRLLFGGCSAGARGAMFHLDAVAAAAPPGVTVQGLLDSPLWINVPPYSASTVSLAAQCQAALPLFAAQGVLNAACVAALPAAAGGPSAPYLCLMGQYLLPFLVTPYFLNAVRACFSRQFHTALTCVGGIQSSGPVRRLPAAVRPGALLRRGLSAGLTPLIGRRAADARQRKRARVRQQLAVLLPERAEQPACATADGLRCVQPVLPQALHQHGAELLECSH